MSNLFLCCKAHARVLQSRQNYTNQLAVYAMGVVCSLLLSATSYAIDITWTNSNAGWDTPAEWNPSQVPGSNDRAIFNDSATISGYAVGLNVSNDVVGKVLFSAAGKGMYWKNNTNTLTILNSFVMDQASTATAVNTLRTGFIACTNSSGTSTFQVGNYSDGGMGLLTMQAQSGTLPSPTNYPTLIANNFLVTSNNSTLSFQAGTLTTYGGSIDRGTATTFTGLAPAAGDIATWNILGGTNSITYLGSGQNEFAYLNNGGTMDINVSGSNTLWAVGGTECDVGWNSTANLVVSGGAVMTNAGTAYISRNGTGCSNNTVVVTGAGSRWQYGTILYVGSAARNNTMTVSAGAQMNGGGVELGAGGGGSSNNLLTVTDTNTTWNLIDILEVGVAAPNNTLIISNTAQVIDAGTYTALGQNAASTNNAVIVDGAGTVWSTATGGSHVTVGNASPFNNVTVKNGGEVISSGVNVGDASTASNCTVLVTGPGSLWSDAGLFDVGVASKGNQLVVTNGAQLNTANLYVGFGDTATGVGNSVVVAGGSLFVTNASSALFIGGGGAQNSFTFNGGTITVNELVLSSASVFNFNSGVLNLEYAIVTNGSAFVVGNGTSAATLNLLPSFLHVYSSGLNISANATLTGIGAISNNVTLANGATLAPGSGATVGTLTVKQNLTLGNSSVLQYGLGTNSDLTAVGGNLTLGGTLNISNAGGFTNTTYTLFTYSGTLTYNGVTIGSTPNAGLVYTISTNSANAVSLNVGFTSPAGAISGSASVNAGDSGDTYSISSVSGATTYTWTVPTGATITSGQGTTSITVNFGCSATSGTITVTPSNAGGTGGSSSLAVAVTDVGAAGSISGLSTVWHGQTSVTYSIASASGATTYTWTVPSGAGITSGQGTTSITVNYGCAAVSGNVTVTPANGNGCAGGSSSLFVTVTTTPNVSAPNPQTVCAGATANFSVTATGIGLTYQWQKNGVNISDGGSINGSGTSSLTLNNVATGDSGASFDCVVSDLCNSSATSSAATLTVSPTSVGGTASAASAAVCNGDSTTITLSGSVGLIQWQSSMDDVTFASISGATNAAVSTGPVVVPMYYRAVVISSPCWAATSTVASVTINTNAPSISAEPVSADVCVNSAATLTVSASGNGPLNYAWRLRGTGWPSGWSLTTGGGAFFVSSSTGNNDGDPTSNGGNNIDTSGESWGMNNTGGDETDALRPFPAALGVGQTFAIDMDNGKFVDNYVGFSLQNSVSGGQNSVSGNDLMDVWFGNGNSDYTISDATGDHDSGVAFTDAGIHVLVRLTGTNTYAVTITRYIDGSTQSFAGTLAGSGAVEGLLLFDANGVGGSDRNLYFNNVRVASADDNAADPAYSGGWTNGSNGGQIPLVNGGDIAGANTSTLTVSPAALTDSGSYDVCVDDACGLATISSVATLTVNPNPTVFNVTGGGAYCAGGSGVAVGLDGSQSNVNYQLELGGISTGASVAGTGAAISFGSQTAAGSYTVVATNATTGCTASMSGSATVTINPTPSCSVTPASAAICVGGSQTFTVTPSGGTPGYTYLWSDGSTGTSLTTNAAGTYSVTVTDSDGCTTTCSATLTVNPLPTVSVNSASVCAGGSATLIATTGASAPSYLWSPGGATTASITVSPAATTTYTVTVTDGSTGCANSGSGTVTVNPLPTVSVNSATVCAGGSATLTATTGASSPSYLWSPGGATTASIAVSPASTTTYTVTVTDGSTGCANNGSGTVTVNPLPSTPTAGNNGPIIEGNTLNLTASTVDNTIYSWTGPNGFASTNQNPSISNATSAASGAYLVTVTDSNGCTSAAGSTTALVTALQITSITTVGNDIHITWLTTGGETNAVQATVGTPGYNTNFVDISGPLLILGSGDTSTNYVDVGAATNSPAKFYRVRLVP